MNDLTVHQLSKEELVSELFRLHALVLLSAKEQRKYGWEMRLLQWESPLSVGLCMCYRSGVGSYAEMFIRSSYSVFLTEMIELWLANTMLCVNVIMPPLYVHVCTGVTSFSHTVQECRQSKERT